MGGGDCRTALATPGLLNMLWLLVWSVYNQGVRLDKKGYVLNDFKCLGKGKKKTAKLYTY